MKRILGVLFTVAVLAGCASTPMSSIYDGAKPSHVIENGDGSTTFEFVFPYDDFDGKMAMQRINEYLISYSSGKGFSGYDIENVDGKVIDKPNGGHVLGAFLSNWGNNEAQNNRPPVEARKDQFIRALVQVKFKTAEATK